MLTSPDTAQSSALVQDFAPDAVQPAGGIFLSMVIPIYNDAVLAEPFCKEFKRVMSGYLGTDDLDDSIELLFVDDGSRNDSAAQLCALSAEYGFVKVVELSKNFGQHVAQSCGYSYSTGSYIATSNVDMQDPLYELPRLLEHIRNGNFDYVRGVRRERNDALLKRLSSWLFFWFFEKLAGIKIPRMPSTMRVMSRQFIDSFNQYKEKVRFEIGLEYWLGFKCSYLEVDHVERQVGKSTYNFNKRLSMAIEAIVSFSDLPLKFGIYGGCALATAGMLLGVWYLLQRIFLPLVLPGFTSIMVILLVSQGAVLIILGIMGLYIGRILKEVQNRPLFVVRNTHNIAKKPI